MVSMILTKTKNLYISYAVYILTLSLPRSLQPNIPVNIFLYQVRACSSVTSGGSRVWSSITPSEFIMRKVGIVGSIDGVKNSIVVDSLLSTAPGKRGLRSGSAQKTFNMNKYNWKIREIRTWRKAVPTFLLPSIVPSVFENLRCCMRREWRTWRRKMRTADWSSDQVGRKPSASWKSNLGTFPLSCRNCEDKTRCARNNKTMANDWLFTLESSSSRFRGNFRGFETLNGYRRHVHIQAVPFSDPTTLKRGIAAGKAGTLAPKTSRQIPGENWRRGIT